jgi:hypothetical protein
MKKDARTFTLDYVARQNRIEVEQVTDDMTINNNDHFFNYACLELCKVLFGINLSRVYTVKEAIEVLMMI